MWNTTAGLSSQLQLLDGTASNVVDLDPSTEAAIVDVEIVVASEI